MLTSISPTRARKTRAETVDQPTWTVTATMKTSGTIASTEITTAVKVIHDTVGVPLSLFPVLAALEIAGGLGLLAGIFRPKLGVAGGGGLVLYFVGAMVAHVLVGDFAGLKAPIGPLLMSSAALTLRVKSMPRSSAG